MRKSNVLAFLIVAAAIALPLLLFPRMIYCSYKSPFIMPIASENIIVGFRDRYLDKVEQVERKHTGIDIEGEAGEFMKGCFYLQRATSSVYKEIIARRSIRKFKQEKINPSLLKKFINAARLAPSAANLQPLEYLIITKKNLKDKIFANVAWAGYIKPEGNPNVCEKPTAYILILVNKDINPNADKDIGAICQNITLAAMEEGIGCCWIGSFNKKEIDKIFGFPENYSLKLILTLGFPLEKPKYLNVGKDSSIKYYKDSSGTLHVPKRKLEDIIHYNGFK